MRGRLGRQDPSQVTTPASPPKKSIITRLGKQHAQPSLEPEEPVEKPQPLSLSYRIPWTAETLLQKTRDCRHGLGDGLKAQLT